MNFEKKNWQELMNEMKTSIQALLDENEKYFKVDNNTDCSIFIKVKGLRIIPTISHSVWDHRVNRDIPDLLSNESAEPLQLSISFEKSLHFIQFFNLIEGVANSVAKIFPKEFCQEMKLVLEWDEITLKFIHYESINSGTVQDSLKKFYTRKYITSFRGKHRLPLEAFKSLKKRINDYLLEKSIKVT